MSRALRSLTARHSDLTRSLIVDSAVELIEQAPVHELSVRAVARHARISERTVFRYFPTRDELLDAMAREVSHRLNMPADPTTVEELLAYPDVLYGRFEATAALTKAALHSELYHRIRGSDAERRGSVLRGLVDRLAPSRPESDRKLAAANIRYHLIATTWHYYRYYFGLSLEESVECARIAIVQALEWLGVRTANRSLPTQHE